MIRKINASRKAVYVCFGLIFIVILLFNIFTPMFLDDYTYLYSFSTGKRINNVFELVDSVRAHYYVQNGRLVVHFFSQLFLMLPPIVFDVVNSCMFVVQIVLIYYYCGNRKKDNLFLLLVITALIWKFVPAFGQVYLWLSGACNYSWSLVFGLLYIFPYVSSWEGKKVLKKKWQQTLYIIAGILMGGSLESISFGIIVISIVIIGLIRLYHKKMEVWMISSIIMQILGYVFMMVSPASNKNKIAKGLSVYIKNFFNVFNEYKENMLGLFIIWLVLIICASYFKVQKEKIGYSLGSMILSLGLNFIHIPAAYYVERCMLGSAVFLIMAIVILFSELWETKYELLSTCVGMIMILLAVVEFFPGTYDIVSIYKQYEKREAYIMEEKEKGKKELEIDTLYPSTKYVGSAGIRELQIEPNVRPNTSMASYYGVDSIVGK